MSATALPPTRPGYRFWVLGADGSLSRRLGYDCGTDNADSFWFPSMEVTLTEGVDCFRHLVDAKDVQRVRIPQRIQEHRQAIDTLNRNLSLLAP